MLEHTSLTCTGDIDTAHLLVFVEADYYRTALYHPLTPLFVLFCNVVATSNKQDFETLQRVASGLDNLAEQLIILYGDGGSLDIGLYQQRRAITSMRIDPS